MTDVHDRDDALDEEDVPLDEDDFLIQRYLDGTLGADEATEVELRADEDDAFGSRIAAYEQMFAALDRSAVARAAIAWADESMPATIVERALGREIVVPPTPRLSWIERLFGAGGWKPAVAAFAVADLVLVGIVGVAALLKSPDVTPDQLVGSLDGAAAGSLGGLDLGVGGLDLVVSLIGCLILLGTGLLLMTVAPDRTRNIRRTVEASPLASLVVGGLATLGLGLIGGIVLFWTCIGTPLVGAFTLFLWAVGMTGLLEAVGDRLPLPEAVRSRGWDFVAGVGLLALIAVIGSSGGVVAGLAVLATLALSTTAMGAAVLSGVGKAPFPRD